MHYIHSPAFWRNEGLPGLAELAAAAQAQPRPVRGITELVKGLKRWPRIWRGAWIAARLMRPVLPEICPFCCVNSTGPCPHENDGFLGCLLK